MWAWPGSRDCNNSTVQTAAMGQIPRSTERILVVRNFGNACSKAFIARLPFRLCILVAELVTSVTHVFDTAHV